MRPFSSIRKQTDLRSAASEKVTVDVPQKRDAIPMRPTQILPAMEIGLQILASMDPAEARRIYRSQKKRA